VLCAVFQISGFYGFNSFHGVSPLFVYVVQFIAKGLICQPYSASYIGHLGTLEMHIALCIHTVYNAKNKQYLHQIIWRKYMKHFLPFIIVFAVALALCIYNISGQITIPLIAGIALISCFWALLGGTVILLAMWLAKGL
jgi:hypothetical protein